MEAKETRHDMEPSPQHSFAVPHLLEQAGIIVDGSRQVRMLVSRRYGEQK